MNQIKNIICSILKFVKTVLYDNYKPEFFGTYADWVGIVFTVLAIYFTIRLYNKDNKINFAVSINKINKVISEDGLTSLYSSQIYVIQAYNSSKVSETISFSGIRHKYGIWNSIWRKLFRKKPEYLQTSLFQFFEEADNFEYIESKSRTKEQKFESHWIDDFVAKKYKETKKSVSIEVVYITAVDQEFIREAIFEKEYIESYIEELKKNDEKK